MQVTADRLRLTKEERAALRAAGISPADLVTIAPAELVDVADKAIDLERATELVSLADLLDIGLGTNPSLDLMRLGVRGSVDLATRDPADLFVAHLATTARTSPRIFDLYARAVHLAGGDLHQCADPLELYWRYRHGDTPIPTPTKARFRMPTLGVSASLSDGTVDANGQPVMPLQQHEVVRVPLADGIVCTGHWTWNGGHGAFAKLEHLLPGDGVEIAQEWFVVESVELVATTWDDPPSIHAGADAVFLTPVHRRVGIIGWEHMVRPVERAELRTVVRAAAAEREQTDTHKRPAVHLRGAW